MSAIRKNQRDRILALLIEARGQWVPLPQILDLKISQFGARIKELRGLGFKIRNRVEVRDRQRRSWYRLEPSAAEDFPTLSASARTISDVTDATLFGVQQDQFSMVDRELGRRGGR